MKTAFWILALGMSWAAAPVWAGGPPLTGQLLQKDGRTWPEVSLQLLAADNHAVAETLTGEDGLFSLPVPADGPWRLHVDVLSNDQTAEMFSPLPDLELTVKNGRWQVSAPVRLVLSYSPDYIQAKYRLDFERFAREDAARFPAPGGAVMAGSSTFRMWETAVRDFAPLPVINRGFGGSTMEELLALQDKLVWQYKPKVVLIYEGTNDLLPEASSLPEVLEQYSQFLAATAKALPGVKFLVFAINHTPARDHRWPVMSQANAALKALAAQYPGSVFVDLVPLLLDAQGRPDPQYYLPDGQHLNAKGYARWAPAVKPLLQTALAEK